MRTLTPLSAPSVNTPYQPVHPDPQGQHTWGDDPFCLTPNGPGNSKTEATVGADTGKDRPLFFPLGLYGFGQYHDFRHQNLGKSIVSVLTCCAAPSLRFLTVKAENIDDFAYHPQDMTEMVKNFGPTITWDLFYLLTIRLEKDRTRVTANVLAPLLIQNSGTAHQLILDGGRYPSTLPVHIPGL